MSNVGVLIFLCLLAEKGIASAPCDGSPENAEQCPSMKRYASDADDSSLMQVKTKLARMRDHSKTSQDADDEASDYCCTAAQDNGDMCGTCWDGAKQYKSQWCGQSAAHCKKCGQTQWCTSGSSPTSTPTAGPVEPTNGPTTVAPTDAPESDDNGGGGGGVCVASGEDCRSAGCCSDPGMTCYEKDQYWASCKKSCTPGIDPNDDPAHQNDWSCKVIGGGDITPTEAPTDAPETPTEAPQNPTNKPDGDWDTRSMKMTHYWDCSGQGCDATVLQPWDKSKYVSPPGYGPQDPNNFGGAIYGERMWLTGAASDAMASLLGGDDGCCGKDTQSGGCGKCLLVQNPEAVNSDWTAVIMKKNRCPPWTNGCAASEPHFDVAAPGFDNLQWSTANVCGKAGTGFGNQKQSEAVGSWWNTCKNTADCAHLCKKLPSQFQAGCRLFASWGWTAGDPSKIKFKAVTCPDEFVKHVGSQFGAGGVVGR